MRDMDWKILNELYHFHNITKAASALYITQPALTKRLQAMEQELGVQIVLRSKNGVIFTSAGEYLAKCAQKQVQFMDEIRYKLDYLQNEQQGTLIVGTSYSFSRVQLPAIIKKYKKLFPNIEMELICAKSEKLAHMAETEQVHVAFVRGRYEGAMEQVKIAEEAGFVLNREKIDIDTLPDLQQIGYDYSAATKAQIEQWWNERYDARPRFGMSASFLDSAWILVGQGLGYTICFLSPEQEKKLNLWKYPMIRADGEPIKRCTYCLYKNMENQPDYVKAFIHMIREEEELGIN